MSDITDDRTCLTSSPDYAASQNAPRKPVRPPTITPRRFKKFFTPASTSNIQQNVRMSRRALQDITNPPGKERPSARFPRLTGLDDDIENATSFASGGRGHKRKLSFASVESPLLESPLRPDPFFLPSSQDSNVVTACSRKCSDRPPRFSQQESDEQDVAGGEYAVTIAADYKTRDAVRPFRVLSKSSNILSNRLSGRSRQKDPDTSNVWQYETASFYSNAKDTHFCGSHDQTHPALPFCAASCKTNSLVAIGDEEGGVRLLDSAPNVVEGFSKAYLTFKPHDNAVMDLDFSSDDRLLVTGSGDQTCLVTDMLTQQPLNTLSGHSSSIKQVQFQPGSRNSIVASCSRDGNVNIWDLRTRSIDHPAQQLYRAASVGVEDRPTELKMQSVSLRDTIRAAHSHRDRSRKAPISKPKSDHRRDEASITSLVFLEGGREHLLATASEADATVKLWDMRTTYDTRRARPLPLSTTRQPHSHETHRRFGLTSMALSSDSARLYTLCRDHTIYAYSVSHLILGSAPELTTTSFRARRAGGAERDGLGPTYGFRHPQLQVSTFYVKLSVRKQRDNQTELLAAGSGNDCSIVFPTNERYLGNRPCSNSLLSKGRRCFQGSDPRSEAALALNDGIPIYQHGTALVRGHRKEVTAVAWTDDGQLVTASDDFHVRCWREGGEARDLRIGGEGQGRRWMCGWADADTSHDDDEHDQEDDEG